MRALENDRISSTEKDATKECRQYQEEYGREDKGNEMVVLPCGQGLQRYQDDLGKTKRQWEPHNMFTVVSHCVDLNYVALDQPSLQLLRNDVDNV